MQVRENVRGYTVEGLARESRKGKEVLACCTLSLSAVGVVASMWGVRVG